VVVTPHVIKVETKERTKYTNKVTILKNKDMLAFFPENRKYYFGLESRLYVLNLILKCSFNSLESPKNKI
jgi:hypothetical protein